MLDRPASCKAYQVSDQATCPACSLTWDMNDPEPPMCKVTDNSVDAAAQRHVERKGRKPSRSQPWLRRYG